MWCNTWFRKSPYPFKNDSVNEIFLSNVQKHIVQQLDTFINIIKELYRICTNNTLIIINMLHLRHEDFLTDPTLVWPIIVLGLSLFDQNLIEIGKTLELLIHL